MAIAAVAVGGKITASKQNEIISTVNQLALTAVIPTGLGRSGTAATIGATGGVTVVGCTQVQVYGAFTSTFTNYRIIAYLTLNSGASITARMVTTTTSDTAAVYDLQLLSGASATASASQSLAQTSWTVSAAAGGVKHRIVIDLLGPVSNVAGTVTAMSTGLSNIMSATDAAVVRGISGRNSGYDGIQFLCSNSFSGNIRIYGYGEGL